MRTLVTVGSIGFCLCLSVIRLSQPDWLVPVTLVPAWLWAVPGVLLLAAGFRRDHVRLTLVAVVGWGTFAAAFVEEARTVLTRQTPSMTASRSADGDARTIRIVSLNCNVGQIQCVEEAFAWHPDVLLLQESPGHESLERIAVESFGKHASVVYGGDVAILVKGTVLNSQQQIESHFVEARVKLQNGTVIDVVSTRLSPPSHRVDFWSKTFWQEHHDVRRRHRQEVAAISNSLSRLPDHSRVLVGGDFNMPPDDAALHALSTRLSDVFPVAGQGWGNTATNEYPLFRVDQIWARNGLRPVAACSVRTKYSDHRMVVCDLVP